MLEIIMVSANQAYMDRFVRHVRTSTWNAAVHVHLFSNADSFREFHTAPNNGAPVVVIDSALWEACLGVDETPGELRFRLTSHDDEEALPCDIRMYQPASQLLLQLVQSVEAAAGDRQQPSQDHAERSRPQRSPRESRVIAVTSPFGGSGVTTVAYHLARIIAMRQEKVLYFNMELYPEPLFMPEAQYDFSRFHYMLATRPQELEPAWQQYIGLHEASGVYGFRPATARRDLRDVRTEHLNEAVDLIRRAGFQTIVMDADAHWLDDIVEGKLRHDECWLVVPWSKRKLSRLPALKALADKNHVRLIINQPMPLQTVQTDIAAADYDAVLPYVGMPVVEDQPLVASERFEAVLTRLIQETALDGGGIPDG